METRGGVKQKQKTKHGERGKKQKAWSVANKNAIGMRKKVCIGKGNIKVGR